jgi:hypothetical protein
LKECSAERVFTSMSNNNKLPITQEDTPDVTRLGVEPQRR